MKKILVTGINGFVASHFINHYFQNQLELKYEILGVDLSTKNYIKIKAINLDLTQKHNFLEVYAKFLPDIVIHFASINQSNQKAFEVNHKMAFNLLQTISNFKKKPKLIWISSSAVYGTSSDKFHLISEDEFPSPSSIYGISKYSLEMLCKYYCITFDIKYNITRAFNHCGPGEPPTLVSSSFAKQIAEIELLNKPPIIKVGNLETYRDFSDVRDVVSAYWAIIENEIENEVINVSSSKITSIEYVLKTLTELTKKEINIEIDTSKFQNADVAYQTGDNTKLKKLTNWQPNFNLNQSLLDLLNYWRKVNELE